MEQPLPAYLVSFAVTLIAMVVLAPVARSIGLVDQPGGHKTHQGNVPLIGGVAMYLGLLAATPFLTFIPDKTVSLLAAGGLLIAVGVLDDRYHLPVWVRFVAQIGAALIMVYGGGVVLYDLGLLFGNETLYLGRYSVIMTVFATVGVINSFNMSDGLDGLAGSLALVACVALALFAEQAGRSGYAALATTMAAVLLAFLVRNAPLPGRPERHRVFMGDAGSTLIGFYLAWMLIDLSQGRASAYAPVTALWLIALPLMDTVAIMLRRLLKRRSPFAADREHLHHIFIVAGYSNLAIVGLALAGATTLAATGYMLQRYGVREHLQYLLFLGLFAGYFFIMRHAWKVARHLPFRDHAGTRDANG